LIAWAPGSPVWNLAQHVPWLTRAVIAATAGCAAITPVLLLLCWRRPRRFRLLGAVLLGLALVVAVRHAIIAFSFVPRPFAADHFQPLYPHPPDSSFPLRHRRARRCAARRGLRRGCLAGLRARRVARAAECQPRRPLGAAGLRRPAGALLREHD
jgi:hypothetical protein